MSNSSDPSSQFAHWVDEHRGILLRVVRSFASAPADAADLQQELLVQLWRSWPAFAGQSKPSTWVYRVCLNTALTWRRGQQRRESKIDAAVDLALLSTDSASPAEHTDRGDRLQKLYDAIHTLPASSRALVLLHLDGLSYREIAEVTGLTENHVGVALTHARKRLAEKLKEVTHELG